MLDVIIRDLGLLMRESRLRDLFWEFQAGSHSIYIGIFVYITLYIPGVFSVVEVEISQRNVVTDERVAIKAGLFGI